MLFIFIVLVFVFLIIAQISKKFITRSIDQIQTHYRSQIFINRGTRIFFLQFTKFKFVYCGKKVEVLFFSQQIMFGYNYSNLSGSTN